MTPSGTCSREVHELMSPGNPVAVGGQATKEVAPTHRTRWPGGTAPALTPDSKWGLAPPRARRTGSRRAAGKGSTGFPQWRHLRPGEGSQASHALPDRQGVPQRPVMSPCGHYAVPFMYILVVSTISW